MEPAASPDLDELEEPEALEGSGEGSALARVDLRLLTDPVVIRSLLGIVAAALIILWPNRTDRILARLIGLALVVLSLSAVASVVRLARRADGGGLRASALTLLSSAIGVAVGATLILAGQRSEETLGMVVGAVIVGLGVKGLIELRAAGGTERGWLVIKSLALMAAGAVVIAFPADVFATMTVLFAIGWAVVGAVAVALSLDPEHRGTVGYRDANAVVVQWLLGRPKDADDRQALYDKILYEGVNLKRRVIRFVTLMSFAAVIASMGVITDSTAVVIGAMLIAPLMTPLMGMAISLVMGWPTRLTRAAVIAAGGVVLAIVIGVVMGTVAPTVIDTASNGQILARTSPTTLDLIVAVAAGAAGAYGLSRPDVSDSLPGVAIAISLVPPLTVVGIAYSQGDWSAGNGALLLFATNMLAILIMGGVTFVVTGVTPISRVTANQHRVKTWVAAVAAVGCLVVGGLLLNGSQLTANALRAGTITDTVDRWLEPYPDYDVVRTGTAGDRVTVVIIGPSQGRPPAAELASLMSSSLDRRVSVEVRLLVEEREIAESE